MAGTISIRIKTLTGDDASAEVRLLVPGATSIQEVVGEYRLGRIQKAGIRLVQKKNVPYFYTDPTNPSRLIRLLNRKKEPVVFDAAKRDFVVCT